MSNIEAVIHEMKRQHESLRDYQTENGDVANLISWKCAELENLIDYLKG